VKREHKCNNSLRLSTVKHARKLNELFRSVSGTPSRVTADTVLDGVRKRVVGTIREAIAPTQPAQVAPRRQEGRRNMKLAVEEAAKILIDAYLVGL
jgi:hypothetical protein